MEPRELTDHAINPANKVIKVQVHDGPGVGGACHEYAILVPLPNGNELQTLRFQNGPVDGAGGGVNGITMEALLAIVIDRLRGFQSGSYACRENALALTHAETALLWLHHRTSGRVKRGVEGTHKV